MGTDVEWNVVWGAACPPQLLQLAPEDVRAQIKFREVLERNYSYVRVKAQIAGTDRPVAVHLIENVKLDARPGLREQVQRTIQCYAELQHDHILQFYVAFEDATFVYIVTELETGHEVSDLLRCHPSIPDVEVHSIAVAGVSALVYLHRKGLIHGALCPQSFVYCQSVWKVKFPIIIDSATHPGNNRHLPYMAPEQIIQLDLPCRSLVTPKSDMWNLAAVLFHCLVGYAPFGPIHVGEDPTEGILRDEPFIPYAIPHVLRWIVEQGLAKEVQLRCSALDAWITLLQVQADELHSDSDAESCSLPMWAARRHDDESDSILAWPEDESPKWMVSTVPDVAGPSDQVASDSSSMLGFGRGVGDPSGSDTGSAIVLGVVDDVLQDRAGSSSPTAFMKHGTEIECCMSPDSTSRQRDTIGSCPASPHCSALQDKQQTGGCSHAGVGEHLGVPGGREVGLQKRSRQLIQHVQGRPRDVIALAPSLDTSSSSRDQEHATGVLGGRHIVHRKAKVSHRTAAGGSALHRMLHCLAPSSCFAGQEA